MHLNWTICLDLLVAGERAEKNNPLMRDDKYLRFSFHRRFFWHCRLAVIFLCINLLQTKQLRGKIELLKDFSEAFVLKILLSGKLIYVLFWEAHIYEFLLFLSMFFFSLTGSRPSVKKLTPMRGSVTGTPCGASQEHCLLSTVNAVGGLWQNFFSTVHSCHHEGNEFKPVFFCF